MNEMTTGPHPTSPTQAGLRASDTDRDRVARVLAEALGDGRLDQQEHAERLEAAYAAKTMGDLALLTHDLGAAPPVAPGTPAGTDTDRELLESGTGSENITAVCGTARREGRWLVEPRTTVSALCGSVELDTRQAVMARNEVTVQISLILSGMELTVPPGVRVIDQTSSILGGTDAKCARTGKRATADALPDTAPTVRLTGLCLLAGVKVRTLPAGDRP